MGNTIVSSSERYLENLHDIKYDYEYIGGHDLSPNSDYHNKLVDKLLTLMSNSSRVISSRYNAWNEIDYVMTGFVDLTEKEKLDKDNNKPVPIVFPYSYAILEALLSYLSSVFLSTPIFMYEGVAPEDELGAILLEKLIELQCEKAGLRLPLHTLFRDGLIYGVGYSIPIWETDHVTGFEGIGLQNIDPYLAFPDPNLASHEAKKGSFFGWISTETYNKLVVQDDKALFNVKYLRHLRNRTSTFGIDMSKRSTRTGIQRVLSTDESIAKSFEVVNLFVNIIPKELDFGDSEVPENWWFSIAADSVLIRAMPLVNISSDLPIVSGTPDPDGYSISPLSKMESLYGLQGIVDWLFNSHIKAVQQAVNNIHVIDPYRINAADFTLAKEQGGGVVRVERAMFGQSIGDAIFQVPINDVTQNHMRDIPIVIQAMERIGGADEATMGMLRRSGPERLTGAEFEGTQHSFYTRLERMGMLYSEQLMKPLGIIFAKLNSLMLSKSRYLKMTGRWTETLMKNHGIASGSRQIVTPDMLQIDFDIITRDGSVPKPTLSNLYLKMIEIISSNKELYEKFDITRIFSECFTQAGVKNADTFIRLASTEHVRKEAQAGNIVPQEEYAKATNQTSG